RAASTKAEPAAAALLLRILYAEQPAELVRHPALHLIHDGVDQDVEGQAFEQVTQQIPAGLTTVEDGVSQRLTHAVEDLLYVAGPGFPLLALLFPPLELPLQPGTAKLQVAQSTRHLDLCLDVLNALSRRAV